MNFQDLQIFLHLAETQNFAKTATQNHMSPSTLSRQIQRMEEELEQPLFIRDNRQVRLTEQGEKFLQFAKAESPILVTLLGIVMEVRLLQPLNA